MSKILNIGDGYSIKINKNNLQPQFTVLVKTTYSEQNSLSFTLTTRIRNSFVLILCENNYSQSTITGVCVHDNSIYDSKVSVGLSGRTISINEKTITISVTPYTTVTLVDFAGNTWV